MKARIPIFMFFVFLSLSTTFAQNGKVSTVKVKGTVIDAEGFPIRKGDVFVDSLRTGFRTNKKGEFKLRIPSETNVLSIFSSEYGMQSIVYNGEEEVNLTFSKNTAVITEQELSGLGYIFDADVFRNIGKKSYSEYQDIFQIIREKFTGVTISGGSIYVRGFIGGDQTPLFVVDGNYVNSIAGINPDELQSIELLKGENSALYGSRGAPGVFVITLKK